MLVSRVSTSLLYECEDPLKPCEPLVEGFVEVAWGTPIAGWLNGSPRNRQSVGTPLCVRNLEKPFVFWRSVVAGMVPCSQAPRGEWSGLSFDMDWLLLIIQVASPSC